MKNSVKQFSSMLFIALLSGIFSVFIYQKLVNPSTITVVENKTPTNQGVLTNLNIKDGSLTNFEYAAEISTNAVVHIKTESVYQQQVDPLFEFFYGRSFKQNPQVVQGAGSGVILSEDGYIVTNNHVIDRTSTINVTLNNKKTYQAELIGTDPSTDLALLKINANGLPSVSFGNSNELNVGQWVLAVGNPFNLTSTVTAGIISAKARNINILSGNNSNGLPPIESFIQTDAAVNPGNSGGALVNSNGELIGINTAIQSNTGSYTGYSFAIPSNIVQKVVNDLKEFGTVQRAFIGVSIQNIDENVAKELNLKDLTGVYVNSVTKNGSAAKSGIKSGDIIKKVGNKKVTDVPELQEQISQFRPGDKVNITIYRDEKEMEIPVTLKNLNGEEDLISYEENKIHRLLGARLGDLDSKTKKELNIENGIKVEEVFAGKLRSVGIREGFIITKINQTPVKNVKEFTNTLSSLKGGVLIEGFYENGKREFYGFGV
ncbi:MAG: Periplasmic pH-dependent serine endoprotease DegQ [Flavobacteriales bacterium]|nr:Periplasmic pH-dependent serine endoprotease DegQ [Flavobacteriales bacterium]